MSKAAMNQLTRNLACEWAPSGVRVNAVAPWYTATELAQQVPSRTPSAHCPETPSQCFFYSPFRPDLPPSKPH